MREGVRDRINGGEIGEREIERFRDIEREKEKERQRIRQKERVS